MSGTNLTPQYRAAMAASFLTEGKELIVPAQDLDRVVEIPLGFQPLGIAARTVPGGDEMLIADYFMPAICKALVRRDGNGLRFTVDWIRGAEHGIERVRLFPDVAQPGGANRAQTVNFGPNGTILVSRNGGREFFVLSPEDTDGKNWRLTGKIALPFNEGMVHSALLEENGLTTIESSADLASWWLCSYPVIDGGIGGTRMMIKESPWTHGLARDGARILTVTDDRCNAEPHGIYADGKVLVPDVCGNGICRLSDGSALVTRYGYGKGLPFGSPGALIYIPAKLLAAP